MNKMLTKRQKRVTRQVRISADIHKEVKKLAIDRGVTVSRLIDEVLLGDSELNSLVACSNNRLKKHNKRIKKIIHKERKKITKDFNEITF